MFTPPAPAARPTRLQTVTNLSGYDYLLAFPEKFATRSRARWPLLLFLHGAGQRGSDVWTLTEQGIPRLLANPAELTPSEQAAAAEIARSCIVLAPQCPHYEVWNEERLLRLLDEITALFPVDDARVYLTGLSMGGFGAWSLAMRHPERFAALVAICGGGRLADLKVRGKRQTALRELGVWAFHGAKDPVVPLLESERMIAGLKQHGAKDVHLTVYPEAGHDAWTAAYTEPKLYKWLLRHRRK